VIHQPQTIQQNLDDWFCKYKLTSSDPVNKPAGGRLDPLRMITLFTVDTKTTVDACKEKAQYLSDPLPLEDMYDMILPNPNSTHQLTEFLSKHGESKLEAFHDRLAHFVKCGMRNILADNLNLAGTARFNLAIRQKRSLLTTKNPLFENPLPVMDRKSIPASWEKVVSFFNHSELWYVNDMAKSIGCTYPFPAAEVLPKDNGERFFSEYINTLKEIGKNQRGEAGECLCKQCGVADHSISIETPPPQQVHENNTTNNANNQRVNINTPQAAPPSQKTPMPRRNVPNAVTRNVGAPAALAQMRNNLILPHIAPQPQPTLLPWWCFPPMNAPPTPCCWKYNEWFMRPRRMGRPPHHPLCTNR